MPLAAYSYPYPPYSCAGSGVNNLHPAPPALADGIHYSPPGPYPCGYPPQYASPAAPSYCCPYVDHRLHHSGALLQSMHPHYPHLHYCPGLPCCSLPPDGLPTCSVAAPDNVDGRGAHGEPPHGPTFAFDPFPNHRWPQRLYPPMPATPLWRPDERVSPDEDVDTEVKGVQGYVPSHSLVPFHDKEQGAKPNIMYGDTPQWRGFPVMCKGNAPFALVPLSNIDGEQNLFVPKKVSTQIAAEEPQKNATAYMDWPLPARNLPIMWKQPGLIPAAAHQDGKEKLDAKDSLNEEGSKVKLNGKDSLNDEVSNSKPLPVVWDDKSPLVLLPAMHEAGKESSSFTPFKLMPITKEVGQELSKVQPQIIMPADKERQQDSDKPLTKSALVTALNEDEKEPRKLEKGKAFMPKNEGPIKVIPVVQLPVIDSSKQKEVSLQKEQPNDVGQGKAGIDHTHAKPQTGQQAGKMVIQAQHVPKQDSNGPSKDPSVQKKGFPAIKLVPPSDAKRCKSPRKNVTAVQEKCAVLGTQGQKKRAVLGTQGVNSLQHGCQAGVPIPIKDASLHEKDSGSNGSDVKVAPSVIMDGKATDEVASLKAVECKLVSSSNVDGRATEEAVSSDNDEQKFNGMKVTPVSSLEATDGSCYGKRFQAPLVSDSEKPQVKMMCRDSAAKCIQAVYRGYCIRRSQPLSQLRIIKEVQASMPDILKQLDSKAEALKELMERRKLSESVMALLFKLDTVQGRLPFVKEQRKCLAKELNRVLETLDNMEQEKVSLSTPEIVNERVKEQEEPSLCTPKAVNGLAKEQEEMPSRSQENISTPKAVTDGEIDCSAKETIETEMTDDEVANLTTAASNACTLAIREGCEGVAVAESDECALVSSSSDDSTREEKVEAGSEFGASELPPEVLQLESMDEDFGVKDEEKPVTFDPCDNLKEHNHPSESVLEHRRRCDPEKKGEEERKEYPGPEEPLKVADMVEEGVTVCCEAPFFDSTREEEETGTEFSVLELPPAVLQVESMDEDSGVDQEKFAAFDSCGNLKEHIYPCDSVMEQRRQCGSEKREEEEKKDPGLEVPVKVADMVEEGVTVSCDTPSSKADAVIPTCRIPDAGRDEKMGNRDDAGEVVRSFPSTSQVREETSEIAKTGVDSNDAMHLADMKQADRLDERVKECGDVDKVVEELKEDAVVSSSPMKIIGTEVMKHVEPRLGCHDFERSVQMDVTIAEEDAFKPSSPTKIIGEEVMEHIEPRLRCHDFEGSVQSQQLNVSIAEESKEEKEVSRLLPDEVSTHPLNSEEVLLENKCLEKHLLIEEVHAHPLNLEEVLLEDKCIEQLSMSEDGTMGDMSTASKVLVGETGVDSLGSNKFAAEMGATDEGETVTAQQILQEKSDVKQEGENATAFPNLQDMLHEEYASNGPHSVEADVALTRQDKLVDGQHVEERGSNLSSNATSDAAEVEKVVDRDGILLHGDAKVEQPLLLDGLVVGNIDDGKETKKDVSVNSTEAMLLVACTTTLDSKMDEVDSSHQVEKSKVPLEDIAVESCIQDAGFEANPCLEESEPKVPLNAIGEGENQIFAKSDAGNLQKHCVEKLALESKNLLAVVEKLAEWNQQQAKLITQLSERMNRIEESRNASKHPLHSRKGRSRRRKINVNV